MRRSLRPGLLDFSFHGIRRFWIRTGLLHEAHQLPESYRSEWWNEPGYQLPTAIDLDGLTSIYGFQKFPGL